MGLDLVRQRDQPVGFAGHGRDDHDHVMTLRFPAGDAFGDVFDALGAADRSAAVFLDYQRHVG